MGRIFSWDEIENKRFPTEDIYQCFQEARQGAMDALSCTSGIYAGEFFGSSTRPNDLTRRSDLDCLIITQDYGEDIGAYSGIASVARRLEEKWRVELDVKILTLPALKAGRHPFGYIFTEELQAVSHAFRFNDRTIIEKLIPRPKRNPVEIQECAHVFEMSLNRKGCYGHGCSNPEYLSYLRMITEVGPRFARMCLSSEQIPTDAMSRKEVVEKYGQYWPILESSELLHKLLSVDERYTQLIEKCAAEEHLETSSQYEEELLSIARAGKAAKQFLAAVSREMNRR